MSSQDKSTSSFKSYEYKEVTIAETQVSMYLDCYEDFGWITNDNVPFKSVANHTKIRFKRDRNIINKAELTRLQSQFEACVNEIDKLEKSITTKANIWALVVGVLGTAFMAGSVFAVTHTPPIVWLCIILAIPAFLGWILPYFIYKHIEKRQKSRLQPLIEKKRDEIYAICEKGYSLL